MQIKRKQQQPQPVFPVSWRLVFPNPTNANSAVAVGDDWEKPPALRLNSLLALLLLDLE
jgi:hypothetical protein